MPDNTIDGTPDAVKVACPVWSGGKIRRLLQRITYHYNEVVPLEIAGKHSRMPHVQGLGDRVDIAIQNRCRTYADHRFMRRF